LELDEKSSRKLQEQGISIRVEKRDGSLITYIQKAEEEVHHRTQNPTKVLHLQHKENLWHLDTTEHLALLSQGSSINIWDTSSSTPTLMKKLEGHILDVNVAKFFPSGKVVLSGGADMLLKIWSLENDGICAAILKGHKRAITACDFVDRGRNVVSSSKDGRAILWNIPTQEAIYSWTAPSEGIVFNDCSLLKHSSAPLPSQKYLDERDFNTEGNLLLCCGSGGVAAFDLRMRTLAFSSSTSAEQNAIVGLGESNQILSGGDDGITYSWDLRKMESGPLATVEMRYKVTRLLQAENPGSCWVACFVCQLTGLFPCGRSLPPLLLLL